LDFSPRKRNVQTVRTVELLYVQFGNYPENLLEAAQNGESPFHAILLREHHCHVFHFGGSEEEVELLLKSTGPSCQNQKGELCNSAIASALLCCRFKKSQA
jgi:hypothetical protein